MAEYKEYLLSVDNFKNPKKVVGKEAIATLLTRIILLEPGTDPLHPTMGVGIVSKYRYLYPSSEEDLKKNITDQINQFLPDCNCANVEVGYNEDKTVNLKITIDDTIFVYDSSKYVPITLASLQSN